MTYLPIIYTYYHAPAYLPVAVRTYQRTARASNDRGPSAVATDPLIIGRATGPVAVVGRRGVGAAAGRPMAAPWPRRGRVVAVEPRAPARRRPYLTVSRPPIRATEQPRKHINARTRHIARSSTHRYGPRFRANRRATAAISRIIFSRRCPSSHARLRSRCYTTLVRPQCARIIFYIVTRARTRRRRRHRRHSNHPWALPSREKCR